MKTVACSVVLFLLGGCGGGDGNGKYGMGDAAGGSGLDARPSRDGTGGMGGGGVDATGGSGLDATGGSGLDARPGGPELCAQFFRVWCESKSRCMSGYSVEQCVRDYSFYTTGCMPGRVCCSKVERGTPTYDQCLSDLRTFTCEMLRSPPNSSSPSLLGTPASCYAPDGQLPPGPFEKFDTWPDAGGQ